MAFIEINLIEKRYLLEIFKPLKCETRLNTKYVCGILPGNVNPVYIYVCKSRIYTFALFVPSLDLNSNYIMT